MKIFILILFTLLLSCSKNDDLPNFSRDQMLSMTRLADPTMRIKVGTIDKALVDCNDYKYPCRTGYLVVIKNLEVKALYYEDQKNAFESAKRLKAFYSRNWVFEDVRGEPILERFVLSHLFAKKAF